MTRTRTWRQVKAVRRRLISTRESAIAPPRKPARDDMLVKALARAWRWQRMLDEGIYTTVSDIGDAEDNLEELRQQDPPAGAAST